jgi:hypothetical protein
MEILKRKHIYIYIYTYNRARESQSVSLSYANSKGASYKQICKDKKVVFIGELLILLLSAWVPFQVDLFPRYFSRKNTGIVSNKNEMVNTQSM